jgi:hypothetical protein
MATVEQIRITIIAVDGSTISYRDTLTGARGRADRRGFAFETGSQYTIEVDTARSRVTRVIDPPTGAPVDVAAHQPTSDDGEPTILVNGVPLERRPDDVVKPGQIRTADIPFTSHRTSERDAGHESKRRPAIIVEIDTDSAAVLAIHGTGSAVAHDGGRRLTSWQELKLRKPSVVSPRTVWVPLRTLGPFISELDHDDRHRFGIDR